LASYRVKPGELEVVRASLGNVRFVAKADMRPSLLPGFDVSEIGVFETAGLGIAALLEAATNGA
jgi:hypothetical protein